MDQRVRATRRGGINLRPSAMVSRGRRRPPEFERLVKFVAGRVAEVEEAL